MTTHPPFFVVGCGRSGTTSLTRILNTASNGVCVVEPAPNLNVETRLAMDGRLANPRQLLEETVVKRVRDNRSTNRVYGEKNLTYGPFLSDLYELLNCRFVYIHRDGRDVVRSLLNWNNEKFGTIYRESADVDGISERAVRNAGQLSVQHDSSDYSRPRPLPGTRFHDGWERFSRAQMCAYYWSSINDLYLAELSRLPPEAWMSINYTHPDSEEVLKVADFCGLEGISRHGVESLLSNRINSLADRGDSPSAPLYPDWRNWDSGMRDRFDEIAAETMGRLGYYTSNYGRWKDPQKALSPDMSAGMEVFHRERSLVREPTHRNFLAWLASVEAEDRTISAVADFGCGTSNGYVDRFAGRRYFGIDDDEASIAWCRRHYSNSLHEYVAEDFVTCMLDETADLVFSIGAIDRTYDVDGLLGATVRNSSRWIYLVSGIGWFPDLLEHSYQWNPRARCYWNAISPSRVRRTLAALGCTDVVVEPVPTGKCYPEPRFETRVIARVPDRCEVR